MLKADLHVHSSLSNDSDSDPSAILEAAEERELDVVSVTDHGTPRGSEALEEAAEEEGSDVLVVPGQEVATPRGHLLVLGPRTPPPSTDLEGLLRWAHGRGGVCVAPHPFQKYRHGIGRHLLYASQPVDGLEVCNSRHLLPWGDYLAERVSNRYSYPKLGGSDAHIPEMVGRVYTLIDGGKTVEGVLEAVRRGRTQVRHGRTPTLLFLKQLVEMMEGRFRV